MSRFMNPMLVLPLLFAVAVVSLPTAPPFAQEGGQPPEPPPPSAPPASEPQPEPEEEPAAEGARTLGGRVLTGDAARWTAEGFRLLRERHFAEAANAYKKAVRAASRHPVAWNNLGSAYLSLGKPQKAARSFRRAISLDPNYALAHYNLGAIHDAVHNYDAAIRSYARALELDPTLNDPALNPAIVNNSHLAAVYLLIYRRHVGALGAAVTQLDPQDEGTGP